MSPRVVFSSPLHHVSERTVSQRVVCLGGVNSESSCSLQFTTLNRDMEEKRIVSVCRLPAELLRHRRSSSRSYAESSGVGAAAPPSESAYDREVGTMEHRRNDMKPELN
ncbi:unnamed protein product [Boreogadus saida]